MSRNVDFSSGVDKLEMFDFDSEYVGSLRVHIGESMSKERKSREILEHFVLEFDNTASNVSSIFAASYLILFIRKIGKDFNNQSKL
jgi:hypothetical protein